MPRPSQRLSRTSRTWPATEPPPVTLVVDDALLLDVLAGVADPELQQAADRGEVHTTGCWYYRLSRALHSEPMIGALSRRLGALAPDRRERVMSGLVDLPAEIGLIGLRTLVPVMQALRVSRPVNMLTAEALAAALALDADLVVLTDHPALRTGALELSLRYRSLA